MSSAVTPCPSVIRSKNAGWRLTPTVQAETIATHGERRPSPIKREALQEDTQAVVRCYGWPLASRARAALGAVLMPEPYCLAMVLCDAAHRDATTGKFTLLGTFSTFSARDFPAKLKFCIYFAVTDGMGPTDITARLVNADSLLTDEEEVVFEVTMQGLDFQSPLVVFESAVQVECAVPANGLYHCELYAGQSLLMSRRLLVAAARRPTGGQNDE